MEQRSYYNEFDPGAAAWLRELIAAGLIMPGYVDERSIADVTATDLRGYTRCHFFAGIGGWDYALRLAGWPDERPVWTGSCPCQPFSAAGKRQGTADARHLWPEWYRLIRECQPATIFGEQVESATRFGWLDGVFGDLEDEGYACGAAVLGAFSVGAPHKRNRLWFVAHSEDDRASDDAPARQPDAERNGPTFGMADGTGKRRDRGTSRTGTARRRKPETSGGVGNTDGVGRERSAAPIGIDGTPASARTHAVKLERPDCQLEHPESDGREQRRAGADGRGIVGGCGAGGELANAESGQQRRARQRGTGDGPIELPSGGHGDERRPWDRFDLIHCRDGKARRIEPGLEPLAHGLPGRVGLLRGYGNAIVPQVAAEFIGAFLETETRSGSLSHRQKPGTRFQHK